MATQLRQTLVNAINRSSTSPNYSATGFDPSVGNVYMNSAPSPAPGGILQNGVFGMFASPAATMQAPGQVPQGPPAQVPMNQLAGAPQALGPPLPPVGDGPIGEPAEQAKDREIERLKRELRKSEEKVNFFRNQVMTLQQQVTSMDRPVMSVNAPPLPDEVARLRSELAEERVTKQQMQAQLRGFDNGANNAGALQMRVQELERELAAYRAGGGSAFASAAAPSRGNPSSAPSSPSGGGYGIPQSPTTRASFDTPGGPKRAVIIGCDYKRAIVTPLRAGTSDAQQWARFFSKRCALTERDIRLLSDDTSDPSLLATKDNIIRSLHWLVGRAAPGDQLFFIFCGHGVQEVVEQYAGRKLCENGLAPTDVCADGDHPRIVSDTDIHQALLTVPSGAQVTLIYDSCHAGQPLDRSGLNYLTDWVARGRVDYEKLQGHPVLPRFLELHNWKARPQPVDAVRESQLRCQAVQWAACNNPQFCVELPIDERPRGVFTYIFINALMKVGAQASNSTLLREMEVLTQTLKGRWRLQQDVQMRVSRSSTDQQRFLV